MTAADKYFLKAKDNYPYDYDEALEALEYGLSHDSEHPGLLTLMGTIYFKELKQFDAAKECFELALLNDEFYIDAYYAYIEFALEMEDYKKAEKLIEKGLRVKGIEKARMLYLKARFYEQKGMYNSSIDHLKKAKESSLNKSCYSFLEQEFERIELKDKHFKEYNSRINIVITQ